MKTERSIKRIKVHVENGAEKSRTNDHYIR